MQVRINHFETAKQKHRLSWINKTLAKPGALLFPPRKKDFSGVAKTLEKAGLEIFICQHESPGNLKTLDSREDWTNSMWLCFKFSVFFGGAFPSFAVLSDS